MPYVRLTAEQKAANAQQRKEARRLEKLEDEHVFQQIPDVAEDLAQYQVLKKAQFRRKMSETVWAMSEKQIAAKVVKQRKYHLACMKKITKTMAKLLSRDSFKCANAVMNVKDSNIEYREKILEKFSYRNFVLWRNDCVWRYRDEVFGAWRCRSVFGSDNWKGIVKTRCAEMDEFDNMDVFYEAMLERDRVLGMRNSLPDEIVREIFEYL